MIKFEFSRSMSESQKLTEVVEILKHLKFQDSEAYTQFCEMVDLAQIIIDFEENNIWSQPTVDAVPVIRCKDCIYFTEYCRIVDGVASNHVCSRKREIDETMHRVKADDYCSWAERKEERRKEE